MVGCRFIWFVVPVPGDSRGHWDYHQWSCSETETAEALIPPRPMALSVRVALASGLS